MKPPIFQCMMPTHKKIANGTHLIPNHKVDPEPESESDEELSSSEQEEEEISPIDRKTKEWNDYFKE